MRVVFKQVIAAAGVALALTASVAQAQTTLRFSNWLPPAHYIVTEMLQPWAKEVETVTEGRVKI